MALVIYRNTYRKKTDWVVSKTLHVITFTFLRFFFKIQKRDFLRFFALLHTFSRIMVHTKHTYNTCYCITAIHTLQLNSCSLQSRMTYVHPL